MLNNYNLFNNEKVDELASIFLEMKTIKTNDLENFIIKMIEYYNLELFCNKINFSNNENNIFGLYNFKQKEILINYKKIINCLSKISSDYYFINANVYRIILHEIKHILQHKMVNNKDNQLYLLFQNEFSNSVKKSICPSEINSEIESTLVILKNYKKCNNLYNKQFVFSINLIKSFYFPKTIVNEFCKENNIEINGLELLDKFLYGIDEEYIYKKKR